MLNKRPRPGPARYPTQDIANRRTRHPPADDDHAPRAPGVWLMAMEFRAFWEFGAVIPAWPLLRQAPAGDGHSVIVFPGLSASDASTLPIRGFLEKLGHDVSGWNQGSNFGPRAGVLQAAKQQVIDTCQVTGRKVSLVGWSLGGIYAREIAKELPTYVRDVITMGTPFAGSHESTNAWHLYQLVSGRDIHREVAQFDLPGAPPVPTTSIFSRTDGIVAWPASIQAPCRINLLTENIEVIASHIGLGLNPSAWWAVADRLSQPEGKWQPFARKGGVHGLIFPNPAR